MESASFGASAKRKIVSSKPKRRPSSSSRLPVTYHHSLRKSGCGPWSAGKLNARGVTLQDVDGDGLADLVRYELGARSWRKNWGDTFGEAVVLPGGEMRPLEDLRLMDLNGDLRPEMVYVVNDTWRAYELGDDGYALMTEWPGSAGVALSGSDVAYLDIDADGRTDVLKAGLTGTILRRGGGAGL